MSEFTLALQNIINERIEEIYQGVCGVVDKFDSKKMRADVEIDLRSLDIDGEEVDLPLLPDIPVGFINGGGGYYIRPFYKKGDLVWITFSSYQIRNSLEGKKLLKSDENKFDLTYAMLSHGLFKKDEKAPTPFDKDGLLIGYKDDTFINILENTLFMQTPKGNYEIDEDGNHSWNDGEVTLDGPGP